VSMAASPVDFAYFFDYLALARGKLLGWIHEQPPAVYTRTFEIGLGSIRATLLHVASSEFGYARRLRGRGSEPENNPFTIERLPDLEPFVEAWERQRPETRAALANVGDPSRPVEYIPTFIKPPIRVRTVAAGIAGQLLFHEIHHRAQVMAMLRQAGAKAENLDYSLLMEERTPVT
jgi:uncharacterized damage-inducible protein DinB